MLISYEYYFIKCYFNITEQKYIKILERGKIYIILSTLVPILFIIRYENKDFSTLGIKKLGVRQYIVLISFVVFSVGGQLIPLFIKGINIRFDLLPICILPLIMTTFFEEFLFRGFIQTRVDKKYGWVAAVLFSGFLFSIYHIGYPGFRNVDDLLVLFAVGIGFSLAYKLSGNNLIVSYFVNLPNAFVTYILKSDQFPPFTVKTSMFSAFTILLIIMLLIFITSTLRRRRVK